MQPTCTLTLSQVHNQRTERPPGLADTYPEEESRVRLGAGGAPEAVLWALGVPTDAASHRPPSLRQW